MEYNLEDMDYRSKLLFGEPIQFEKIWIYPLTIKEISDYSFTKYNKFLSLISFTKTEIMEALHIFDEISLFDFIMINLAADTSNEIKDIVLHMFSLKTKKKAIFSSKSYFIIGKQIIDENNFDKFVQIIKDQNAIKEKEEKVTTKKEQEYQEMLKKAREKHKSYLKVTGKANDTDLLDIISAISCRHPSLQYSNIKNLTIYQLIDTLKRLMMIDEYFTGIDSLLAGADSKKIDLIHWSKKFIDV